MNIGPYTFEEFKEMARDFHGYPAPGLLVGGYMVALAKAHIPEGTLFEAVCETSKCLPDAVQLLTLCSTGNGWMRINNLGRYALALYDKFTGEGVRVWIDSGKLKRYPEIYAWLLKEKPKKDQNTDLLLAQIEAAGHDVCSMAPVTMSGRFLGKNSMGAIGLCPVCTEPYPVRDGAICRGCQGEAPYEGQDRLGGMEDRTPPLKVVVVDEAVGRKALHDMTRIVPGEVKGVEFTAGQVLGVGDICRLQQMGRNRVHVETDLPEGEWVHENEAALAFAGRMAGPGVAFDGEPREGKVNFRATRDGLLVIDRQCLEAFNLVPDVMCAARQGDVPVDAQRPFAGCRAIPLYLSQAAFSRALAALGNGPIFSVLPLRKARVGVLVTGTEVFQGLIEDKFVPIISSKVQGLGSRVTASRIVPDDREAIVGAVAEFLAAGVDLIVTTAGLSVDPDDVTRPALVEAGLTDWLYGAPILPGAMTLVGRIGQVQVLGVPACALFYKTTSLDLLLPRLLAGQTLTRKDLAAYAEGGFCLGCKSCTFPKCSFGK